MLDYQLALNVLVSIMGLAGLWIIFHWPFAQYRRDLLQNRLFAARQELFDIGRRGDLPFDHPAYGLIRTTINGFIRVGPQASLIGVIVLLCLPGRENRHRDETYSARLRRLSQELHPGVRKQVDCVMASVHIALIRHLVFTSLPLAVTLGPLALMGLFKKPFRANLDRIDDTALEIGSASVGVDPTYQLA